MSSRSVQHSWRCLDRLSNASVTKHPPGHMSLGYGQPEVGAIHSVQYSDIQYQNSRSSIEESSHGLSWICKGACAKQDNKRQPHAKQALV